MGKTSSAVKDRYNAKVYTALTVRLPKALVADFKAEAQKCGLSQAGVIKTFIEKWLEEQGQK